MAAPGELGSEVGAVLQPASAQAIKVGAAHLKKLGSFERVDLLIIEL
ncbi:MAG: hypothetical protein JWM16_3701, partial [Verrucomicrobiales bacterium]|nr:hypothetical protein [Verrucomicrobiales bacterium]